MPFIPLNLDRNLRDTNWSSVDMVRRADDFYSSMGLPPMPYEFWTKSNFQQNGDFGKCHGTAANMFNNNDYRYALIIYNKNYDEYKQHFI